MELSHSDQEEVMPQEAQEWRTDMKHKKVENVLF